MGLLCLGFTVRSKVKGRSTCCTPSDTTALVWGSVGFRLGTGS